MPYSRNHDKVKNLLNELSDTLLIRIQSYLKSINISDFLLNYIKTNNIEINEIEKKAQLLGLSISKSTIRNIFYNPDIIPSKRTIHELSIVFEMDEYEKTMMIISLYSRFFDTSFEKKQDILLSLVENTINNSSDDIIIEIIKNYPNITQKELAEIFNVSTRTIGRKLSKLNINNVGSRKKPKWVIR